MVLCILLFFLVKEILLKASGKSIKMKNEKIHGNDWAEIRSFHDFFEENMTTHFQCGEKKKQEICLYLLISLYFIQWKIIKRE